MENKTSADPRIVFFDSMAAVWDGWHDLAMLATRLDAEFDGLGIGASERILDVGCGTGNLTLNLLKRLGAAGRVVALDISPVMLERAQQKLNDPRVTWLQATAGQLPLADAAVDRIICFSAWPHFEDQSSVVREFRRVLRPGGCVHILHLISREEVNRIHEQAHPSVRADVLARAKEVAFLFEDDDFTILTAVDEADRYLLTARKEAHP